VNVGFWKTPQFQPKAEILALAETGLSSLHRKTEINVAYDHMPIQMVLAGTLQINRVSFVLRGTTGATGTQSHEFKEGPPAIGVMVVVVQVPLMKTEQKALEINRQQAQGLTLSKQAALSVPLGRPEGANLQAAPAGAQVTPVLGNATRATTQLSVTPLQKPPKARLNGLQHKKAEAYEESSSSCPSRFGIRD